SDADGVYTEPFVRHSMAAALSDAQLQAVEQQLSSRPEILAAIRANSAKPYPAKIGIDWSKPEAVRRFQRPVSMVLKDFGIDFPDAGDYHLNVDPQGNVQLQRQNFFQRNADWILPVSVIGTAGT